jgi:hypothetical protein
MAIDFKTFNKVAPLVAAVKKPILLLGFPLSSDVRLR